MLDKKIKYFIAVVETGSFSSAARELYLSQSALSQQVSLLESEIGVKLLDRSGYRPVLTEEGKKYYNFCSESESQYRELLHSLRPAPANGTLRIAFTGAFENKALIQLTAWFKRNHKNISFTYIEGTFDGIAEELLTGKADIAFGTESSFENLPIETETLRAYKMCVITSFDHPFAKRDILQPEDLKNQKFIMLSRTFGKSFNRHFLKAFTQDGCLKSQIIKQAGTFDELVASVSIGEGIAIVSDDVVDKTSVTAIPLVHSHHHANYVIAYRPEKSFGLIHDFIESCKIYFHKE